MLTKIFQSLKCPDVFFFFFLWQRLYSFLDFLKIFILIHYYIVTVHSNYEDPQHQASEYLHPPFLSPNPIMFKHCQMTTKKEGYNYTELEGGINLKQNSWCPAKNFSCFRSISQQEIHFSGSEISWINPNKHTIFVGFIIPNFVFAFTPPPKYRSKYLNSKENSTSK